VLLSEHPAVAVHVLAALLDQVASGWLGASHWFPRQRRHRKTQYMDVVCK
jgi:hypothetical protein